MVHSQTRQHTCILGVNHKSAAINERDQLVFTQGEQGLALETFSAIPGIEEVILIATCNRTELYMVVNDEPHKFLPQLRATWYNLKGIKNRDLDTALFFIAHEYAIQHLFRVTCSLDSLIVGEVQILGQIKNAYHFAKEQGTTGSYLNRLFQESIKLGKRVRHETEIGKGAVSISFAAVELLRKHCPTLKKARIGILGTGKMGELAVKNLLDSGVDSIHFINRTFAKAEKMAQEYNGTAWPLELLPEALDSLDIIITCASSCEPLITKQIIQKRNSKTPLTCVDIAAPRNIAADVTQFDEITLFDIDTLNSIVDSNIDKRSSAISEVEEIIAKELTEFYAWYNAQEIVPVLKAMRSHIQTIAQNELKPLESHLCDKEYDLVKKTINSLTNKILHTPSSALKEMCNDGRAQSASLWAKELFGLEI
ncbi:MAG: glutamyl-tRNA reductase [Fibrobacterales bacterium]